jgi:hypothetical protein
MRSYLTTDVRCDQLIPVNQVVNKKEQLEKGLEEEYVGKILNRNFKNDITYLANKYLVPTRNRFFNFGPYCFIIKVT